MGQSLSACYVWQQIRLSEVQRLDAIPPRLSYSGSLFNHIELVVHFGAAVHHPDLRVQSAGTVQ